MKEIDFDKNLKKLSEALHARNTELFELSKTVSLNYESNRNKTLKIAVKKIIGDTPSNRLQSIVQTCFENDLFEFLSFIVVALVYYDVKRCFNEL